MKSLVSRSAHGAVAAVFVTLACLLPTLPPLFIDGSIDASAGKRSDALSQPRVPDKPSTVVVSHQATSQRVILKPSQQGDQQSMRAALEKLAQWSRSKVTLVRSMSGQAEVVELDPALPADHLQQILARLRAEKLVDYAQADAPVHVTARRTEDMPNDKLFGEQWLLDSEEPVPVSLNMLDAWEITKGSSEVVVAIIDTGIRFEHPDLSNRLLPGYDFVSGINEATETVLPVSSVDNYLKANDGDGRDQDPTDPGDGVDAAFRDYMVTLGYDCPISNSTWHGTAMASLFGANGDDGTGMTGVDWRASILPVRAIGRCGGNRSDLLDAIRWAAGVDDPALPPNPTPARIINLSLGIDDVCGPADQIAINEAVRAGAIVVAAVGNHGRNTDHVPSAPADCRNVIGVSAISADGMRANYSNYGDDADIAAPGGDIGSSNARKVIVAANAGTTDPVPGSTHRYTTGTSVASPLVAGVLSLMLSVNPELSNAQLEELLYRSTRRFTSEVEPMACSRQTCGSGSLDAHSAVLAAQDSIDNPPPDIAQAIFDDFLVTTGDSAFGCSIGGTQARPDVFWILCLAVWFLLRRQPGARSIYAGLRLTSSRSSEVA